MASVEGSNNSNYTGTSVHVLIENSLVGNDPKLEKAKLKNKMTEEEVFVGDYMYKAKLIERIAGGSFGEVYLGVMGNKETKVAVKLEPQKSWIVPTVMAEGNIYRKMGPNLSRVPHLYWFGFHGPDNSFAGMIMDLLGPSLYKLWLDCGQEFSFKTLLMVIDETLTCIEAIHQRNCVHRDVSPNNFAITLKGDGSAKIMIFDFGHAQILPEAQKIVFGSRNVRFTQKNGTKVAGTPRFASIFSHLGHSPSYRDDMESLGYVWIYLLKGRLPWQGLRGSSSDETLNMIGKKKIDTPLETLCDRIPLQFVEYFNYVRNLGNLHRPNYEGIGAMFRALAKSLDIEYDWKFDWTS